MDTTKGRMDPSESQASQTSTFDEFFNPFSPFFFGFDPGSARIIFRGLGTDNLPVGTPGRHPSSPFPPETGKGTLETGPSYER